MEKILRRHLITLFILTAIFAAGLLFLIRFGFSMHDKELRVIEAKERLASYENNKKVLLEENKTLGELEKRTTTLETNTVKADAVPELLSSLEGIAKDQNIEFAITTVRGADATTADKTLTIDFSSEGTLANIDAFFTAVQSQAYQVKFNALSLYRMQATGQATVTTDPKKPAIAQAPRWSVLASMQILSF